jgi:hypothetical protein
MKDDFRRAARIRRTNAPRTHIVAVNGCCYGKSRFEDRGDYFKKCGQSFWSFISGDEELYTQIIEPLGHRAKERNEEFNERYSEVINRFTKEFIDSYCSTDGGQILWDEIVKMNSARPRMTR